MAESMLSKYKRQPKLQISLPSNGNWYPPGSLKKAEDIDVYSMTAGDEIGTKTPDTLFSGAATVKIIHSCVPDIKNAWNLPIIDLYTLLSAIRMASYGETTSINTGCPECSEVSEYEISFNSIIEHYQNIRFTTEVVVDDVTFNLAPLSYKDLTEFNKLNFKLQRQLSQKIPQIEDEDKRDEEAQRIFNELSNLQTSSVIHTVKSVKIGDEEERNWNEIYEFVTNAEPKFFQALLDTHTSNMEKFVLPDHSVKCPQCDYEFKTESEFDWSNFFEKR